VTTNSLRYDCVISGASFAGLALARGLMLASGASLRVAVVDKSVAPPSPEADTRAFAVWAAAKTILDGLGAWDAIAPVAQPIAAIEIGDSDRDDVMRPARVTYDAHTRDGVPAGYIVPAAALHQALYQSVAGEAAITWVTPAEAEGLTLDADVATVVLKDGRRLVADLVVAAEGRASALRDAAGIKTVGWDYGQTGIVATVEFSEDHHGVAVQNFLPGGPFAVLPLKGRRACITWSCAADEAKQILALGDAGFVAELDKRIAGRFGEVKLIGKRQSWPLNVKMARDVVARRFALIGDAAHGVHPIAGQGVNLAFKDVAALLDCIVDAMRIGLDAGNGPALERYARWRRFDSAMSAAAYDGINRVFAIDSALLRAGRGAALDLLDQTGFAKRMIVDEIAGINGEMPRLQRGEAL
jgi:2-octaprenyl-6-methoxyphenol hydroxylase